MNRICAFSLLLFSLPSVAQEPVPIDVPAGEFVTVYEIPIDKNGGISCDIDVEPSGYDEDWGSNVLLVFKSSENSIATQVTYSPENDLHVFHVQTLDDVNSYTYRSEFLRLNSFGSATISAYWRDDGVVVFKGRDLGGQQGQGYIINPDQVFEILYVYASGVSGHMHCYSDEI